MIDLPQEPGEVRRVVVFTSPKAGSGSGHEQVPRLADLLRRSEIDTVVTDDAADLQDLSTSHPEFGPSSQVVVAAGGDGTLALAADRIGCRWAFVPMPLGTENLLANHFGHSSDARDVLRTILHGRSYAMDAGRANGRLFLVMVSCGFDAEVVRALHLRRSGHIQRFSYTGPILRALRRYHFPKLHVQIQASVSEPEPTAAVAGLETSIDCCWAMAFNLPKYGGGLNVEPDAVGHDGLLDLIAFRGGSIASGLRYFAGIKRGNHVGFQDVIRKRAATMEIRAEGVVPYQVDGDYGGRLPLRIETLPGHVHLRLPAASDSAILASVQGSIGS